MPCTETIRRSTGFKAVIVLLAATGLVGCGSILPSAQPSTPPTELPAAPAAPPAPVRAGDGPAAGPGASVAPGVKLPPATVRKTAPRYVQLAPPGPVGSEAELKRQFALRLIHAHPDSTYQTVAPNRLLAIPVLEVELNVDGSVRRITVLRRPTTGDEATQLAIAAVHRAAPFGNVSQLKPPFKVVEAFLFDDNMRFKPRTLDLP